MRERGRKGRGEEKERKRGVREREENWGKIAK